MRGIYIFPPDLRNLRNFYPPCNHPCNIKGGSYGMLRNLGNLGNYMSVNSSSRGLEAL